MNPARRHSKVINRYLELCKLKLLRTARLMDSVERALVRVVKSPRDSANPQQIRRLLRLGRLLEDLNIERSILINGLDVNDSHMTPSDVRTFKVIVAQDDHLMARWKEMGSMMESFYTSGDNPQ